MGFVGLFPTPLCGVNTVLDGQRWLRQLTVDEKYLGGGSSLPWAVVCAAELGTVRFHQHGPVPRPISGGESQP